MSSSPLTGKPKSETLEEDTVATSVAAGTASEQSGRTSNNEEERKGNKVAEEEEEEGECGFCLFMKRGGCGEAFTSWENCCHEARKNKENMEDKCFEISLKLFQCMKAHADYYKPMLPAEKAIEEKAKQEEVKEEAAQQSRTEVVLNESEKEPAREEK